MKIFESEFACDCGKNFVWRYVNLEAGETVFARREKLMLNFKNHHQTDYQHIIEIKCPHCNKRHFVEIKK